MQSTKTNLVIPMNTELKERVKRVLDELGFSQAGFIKAVYAEVARTGKLPLSLDINDKVWREPTPEERQLIQEWEEEKSRPDFQTISYEDAKKQIDWLS